MDLDELQKLEYLSLVSKVCTELENHLGINDKDLGKAAVKQQSVSAFHFYMSTAVQVVRYLPTLGQRKRDTNCSTSTVRFRPFLTSFTGSSFLYSHNCAVVFLYNGNLCRKISFFYVD